MNKPKKYKAIDVATGELVIGWYVELHTAQINNHAELNGYDIRPHIFNDDPGQRSNGTYWHEIDIKTLAEL